MQYQQTLDVIYVFVRFRQIWVYFSKQLWPQNRLQRQKEGPKAKIGVTRPKMVSHLENTCGGVGTIGGGGVEYKNFQTNLLKCPETKKK